MRNLYPDIHLKTILEITIEMLNKNNIKGLILDVDNTIIDFSRTPIDGLEDWANGLKEKGIKLCILSNTNNKQKVKNLGEKLGIPYLYFAKKPLKTGFIKAKAVLELNPENIAVVGDQLFTDVIGGNACGMFTILVEPLGKQDIFLTAIKRPIERYFIKRYDNNVKGKEKDDNK